MCLVLATIQKKLSVWNLYEAFTEKFSHNCQYAVACIPCFFSWRYHSVTLKLAKYTFISFYNVHLYQFLQRTHHLPISVSTQCQALLLLEKEVNTCKSQMDDFKWNIFLWNTFYGATNAPVQTMNFCVKQWSHLMSVLVTSSITTTCTIQLLSRPSA